MIKRLGLSRDASTLDQQVHYKLRHDSGLTGDLISRWMQEDISIIFAAPWWQYMGQSKALIKGSAPSPVAS